MRLIHNDPKELVERGLEQLRDLIEGGADLASPRMAVHGFSGDADALEALGYALRQSGYQVEPVEDGELTARAYGIVDEPWLREAMLILCRVADRFSVQYDGWSAPDDPKVVN